MLIDIAEIQVGKRLRGLREATVTELVDSIGRLGLQVPISVASGVLKRAGDADGVSFTLVAGQHRLEACRRLGLAEIEARIVELSQAECELWEIDENLCRADLTELERGEHLARRKELYLRLHPETGHGGDRRSNTFQDGEKSILKPFAEDTAEAIGITKNTVQKAIRRVMRIDEKVRDRIREMPDIANNQPELEALGQMEAAQQRKAVALVESGQAFGIRDARKLMEPRPIKPNFRPEVAADEKWWQQFLSLMSKASDANRQRARDYLEEPVADRASVFEEE